MPLIVVVAPAVLLLVKLLLGLFLIPEVGLPGAAIASTIGFALILMMSGMYLWAKKPKAVRVS